MDLNKVLGLLLALTAAGSAVLVYSSKLELTIVGLSIYILSILALARYVDKFTEFREATGVMMLACISTSIGVLIGAIVSSTQYSILLSLSTLLVAFIFTLATSLVASR